MKRYREYLGDILVFKQYSDFQLLGRRVRLKQLVVTITLPFNQAFG